MHYIVLCSAVVIFRKRRLDEICLERFQQYSRTFIQSWILQGKVFVNGKVVNKAGTPVSEQAVVQIRAEVPKYVCRAGYKLEAAIEQLGIDVSGKVALDSGLSTGGFTDCLLQYGASFVYGVDVGYGQVAEKIRRDERVCVIERTNLRYLSSLPQKVDLVTLDLSFISILLENIFLFFLDSFLSELLPVYMGGSSPCASCKLLRHHWAKECIFAPYFPSDDPHKFAIVHSWC
ncbi:putative rRNA methyltransferase YqxC [Morella rubra]|uniref:Putative rRNA methyltransferase YqxC n=1 Tax=Morella rubra TaxID=262757 RepID=A0A6A1WML5_9ROSI|nr:putative rRNA methyltransferase YqxC [Morella rubra]